jgi:hypothetical protein
MRESHFCAGILLFIAVSQPILPGFASDSNIKLEKAPVSDQQNAEANPSSVEQQITDSLQSLWAKASIICARSHLLSEEARANHSPTLNAIHTLGPKRWTKQKIEQLMCLGGLDSLDFKEILLEYIGMFPENYDGQPDVKDLVATSPPLAPETNVLSHQYAAKIAPFSPGLKQQFLVLLYPVSQNAKGALGEVTQANATVTGKDKLAGYAPQLAGTTTGIASSSPKVTTGRGQAAIAAQAHPPISASQFSHRGTRSAIVTERVIQESAPANTIKGQAYFDDIDSLFEETRAKIEQNFSKFSNVDQQNELANKLSEAPNKEKDMHSSMKQTSNSAIQQFGQFKSGLQQLQNMLDAPK